MGNKVVDSIIEFIKDEDSGELVGYKLKDGTERGIVTSTTDDLTGMIEESAGSTRIFGRSSADQQEFERLLSVNGAKFDGVHDDAPALQAAINAFGTNRRIKLRIPVTGASSIWDTANGSTGFAGSPAGVAIPSNISVDFQNLTVFAHNLNNTNAYALAINGAPIPSGGATYRQFANNTAVYESLIIYSGNGIKGAMNVSGETGQKSAAYIKFRDMQFTGGSNGFGLVTYDNNCWALDFDHCGFYITNAADGFNGPVTANSSNTGATMRFRACNFDTTAGGPTAGGYLCSNTSSGSFDYFLEACSFEWAVPRKIMRYPVYFGGATVTLSGCYIEGNSNYASPTPMVVIPSGNNNSSFRMFGGGITLFNAGSGTQPPCLFDPGPSAASPAGIVLSHPMIINTAGVVMNNAASAGRYLYNP